MRSRVMGVPDGKILIYGFDEHSRQLFEECAKRQRLKLKVLPEDCAAEQIGYLADFSGFSSCGEKAYREEQCVIFSCIDGKKLNSLLDDMRTCGLGGISLKAAVTGYNQKMTLSELMDELWKEHRQMHGIKGEDKNV